MQPGRRKRSRDGLLPDIEGLRGIAILTVVLYHAGLGVLPGGYVGVDVFFVISGFLITSLLVREADKTGHIALAAFYSRRARRLLPAASIVILATLAAIALEAAPLDRSPFAADGAAATASVANWRFALQSVDYLIEDRSPSPFLHFWSLGVEEQFYLVWPALILLAIWIARRTRRSVRWAATAILTPITAASFVACVALSQANSASAFFTTHTRVWELGIGALVALLAPRLANARSALATVAGAVGVGAVLATAAGVMTPGPWPGASAAVPVVGAALAIGAGLAAPRGPVARALGWRPLTWVGGISYALYLWHWPLLVVGGWAGLEGRKASLGLVAVGVLLAWASTRFVEDPIRFGRAATWRPRLTLGAAAATVAVSLTTAFVVVVAGRVNWPDPPTEPGALLGAVALGDSPRTSPAGAAGSDLGYFFPSPFTARDDVPTCRNSDRSETAPRPCAIGDPNGDLVVAVLGDSKVHQYSDALDAVLRAEGARGYVMTKAGCAYTDAVEIDRDSTAYEACAEFNDGVDAVLAADPPDIVIAGGLHGVAYTDSSTKATRAAAVDGYAAAWKRLSENGALVAVILDNPNPSGDTPWPVNCMATLPKDTSVCAFDREAAIKKSAAGAEREAAATVPGVVVVDLTDWICPQDQCAPVIGGVLVYRNSTHITNTYAMTLVPELEHQLGEVFAAARASDSA